MFWRLDFQDGDFVLVESPSILQCDRVRAYHLELHKALQGLSVWGAEADLILYPQFKMYYQKIADLMRPTFDCDRLDSYSRHTFFVCTPPIAHPSQSDRFVAGISGLEQIMGYSYIQSSDKSTKSQQKQKHSTENLTLDVLTNVFLVFKRQAFQLSGEFSREDLAKMVIYASEQMRSASANEESKESTQLNQEKQSVDVEADHILFTKNKDKILEKLRDLSVPLPEF